jgi:hypothetical protein
MPRGRPGGRGLSGTFRDVAALGQRGPEPVAVVAFVAEQFLGIGKRRKQQESALVVVHLAFGQQQHDRPPFHAKAGKMVRSGASAPCSAGTGVPSAAPPRRCY